MRLHMWLAAGVVGAAGAAALGQTNLVTNPGFEDVGPPSGTGTDLTGWASFNGARRRSIGDGLGPVYVRTGNNSIELPQASGSPYEFVGMTTNVFNPNTLEYFDPAIVYKGGCVKASVWYLIPADQPLPGFGNGGSSAGIKLEFRRPNSSVYHPYEQLDITGDTAGQWVQEQIQVSSLDLSRWNDFPEYPTSVSVLLFTFRDAADPGTGTIFYDDVELTQDLCPGNLNCDNVVDVFDLLDYLNVWFQGQMTPPGDEAPAAERTGDVPASIDVFDLLDYLSVWFQNQGPCP